LLKKAQFPLTLSLSRQGRGNLKESPTAGGEVTLEKTPRPGEREPKRKPHGRGRGNPREDPTARGEGT